MSETPNTVHGRLLEAAHISGYTAKRAVSELEWLLDEERWKEVGPGYSAINDFLSSIDLSEFKLAIERRKPLARKLAALQASQRATAKALGVGEQTVARDLGKTRGAPHGAPVDAQSARGAGLARDQAPHGAPAPFQIPAEQVADAAEKVVVKAAKRKQREADLGGRREKKEALAREQIGTLDSPFELVVSDVRKWRPENVAAIVTDPPYVGDSIPLYEALRDFAVDVLPEGAPLVVMTWQAIFPGVVQALEHERLAYRWCICWRYANTENTVDYKRRVFDCWKPVLVYHKGAVPDNARMFRDEIANQGPDKDFHEWGQSVDGFERLVTSFSEPGEVVCDPFLGGGTTAIAALAQARRFAGCDIDAQAVETTAARLAGQKAAAA